MSVARDLFIDKWRNDVVISTCGTGIFPSVKMAQMIIEGANSQGEAGKGITFVEANNAFGIKDSPSWDGQTMTFNTPKDGKPVSVFRKYDSIRDSIADHTKFLKENPRYTKAGVFTAKTPEEQAERLEAAGYSESSNYAEAIIAMIKAYNLKELDDDCKKKSC